MASETACVPLRYLALGDSYTVGESVATADSWPAQLQRALRLSDIELGAPQVVALTGWTTDELAAGMDAAQLTPRWDLVTLQIGVNDHYRGRPAAPYREAFATLLQRAIALANGRANRVVVVSIPDWGVTAFARDKGVDSPTIATGLDAYNAIAREETARSGAGWGDITPISRRQPGAVAADGLHPSAAQYTAWLTAIVPAVRAALH